MVYQTFKYDGFNQLIGTQMNGNINTVSYTYRPDGLRLCKTVSGNTSYFVWSGDNLQAELNSNGQIKSYNVYGNGLVKSDTYDSSNNPITVFYAKNAHGDVVNLTDSNGNNIKNYQYNAFGVEVNKDENGFNSFRCCGEYFDNETDNYYLRARYYNSSLGRFITEDTYWNINNMIYGDSWNTDNPKIDTNAIMQSSNLYVYCTNNPIMYIDPNGLKEVELRSYAEARGYQVKWNANNKSATISKDGKSYIFSSSIGNAKIENDIMLVDDVVFSKVIGAEYEVKNVTSAFTANVSGTQLYVEEGKIGGQLVNLETNLVETGGYNVNAISKSSATVSTVGVSARVEDSNEFV